jgi:ketosteroid isomerase-like protein
MSARCTLASLALATVLAACAKPAEQTAAAAPTVDSAAVKAGVADLWQRWITADTAGNVEALAAMIADSARLDLRGMPPFLDRAAWKVSAEAAMKSMDVTAMTITPEMTVAISNELAYETGNFVESYTTSGKRMAEYGRYATAVQKDADGQWRVGYIMAFADSTVTVRK